MDIDNAKGKVITFYSYKGGTGRSMLVANSAWLLASAGYRILLIDWDLEAPGLHRYFKPFLADPELRETDGVIEWVTDYWDAVIDSHSTDIDGLIREYADPRRYTVSLNTDGFLPPGGGIDLICAGRQNAGYSEAVSNFDYTRLYEELQGADFIAASKALLTGAEGYDFVLVDSRTGVSDTAGICTVGLADALVVCFTYNNQSIAGAANVASNANLQAAELRRAASTDSFNAYRFPYKVIGVPSRVDHLDPERLEKRRAYAAEAFSRVLGNGQASGGGVEQLIHAEVPYHPLYSYEEVLAICMERIEDQRGVLAATQRIVQEVTGNASLTFKPLLEGQQRALRDAFGGGANATSTASASTAWDFFCRHMPDEPSRLAFLDESFAVVIQLVNVTASSSGTEDEPQFARSSLLETETERTADERRVLDRLLLAGVVCRRVSQAGERTLEIADDSIVANWTQLRQRLVANVSSIRERAVVIGCRKSWVAGGRLIGQLAEIPDSISEIETLSERGTWLGKRNLDFINAVRDAKALARARMELVDQRDEALLSHKRDAEKAFEVRRRSYATVAGVVACAVVAAAGAFFYVQDQRAVSLMQLEASKAKAANDQMLALERAKTAELERQAANGRALQILGLGVTRMRSRDWAGANEKFTEAIRIDSTLAEAYFQRAKSAEKLKDEHQALVDYGAFYDLRPSLRGRASLIKEISELDPIDEQLMIKQIQGILSDAGDEAARNLSLKETAVKLKLIIDNAIKIGKPLSRDVDIALRGAITKLDPNAFRQRAGAGAGAAIGGAVPLAAVSSESSVVKSAPDVNATTEAIAGSRTIVQIYDSANAKNIRPAKPQTELEKVAQEALERRAERTARVSGAIESNSAAKVIDVANPPQPVQASPSIEAPPSFMSPKPSNIKR